MGEVLAGLALGAILAALLVFALLDPSYFLNH